MPSIAPPPAPFVLVVEDDATLREVLVEVLRAKGYRARGAKDGGIALCIMALERPAAVVLDLVMPVRDGWAVRREMLRDAELRDVPVIIASAVEVPSRGLAALHVAAALAKPFRHTDLIAAVERALRARKAA